MPQLLLMPDPRPLVERLGSEFFRQMSEKPGVYLMRDATDKVLYVGKAKNLRKRLSSYRVANPDRLRRRHLTLLRAVARIEIEECAHETAALAREAELLRQLQPRFNRAGTWPGKARFLAWRVAAEGLEIAVTLIPDAEWLTPSPPIHPNRSSSGIFDKGDVSSPRDSRSHSVATISSPAEFLRQRAGLQAVRPQGGIFGPLGAGAFPLRAALLRLLWCAIHPRPGLTGMPEGWFHGRHGEVASLPRLDAAPNAINEARERLHSLFTPEWMEFVEWVRARVPGNRPFEIAVRDADLETISNGLKLDIPIG